MAGLIRARVVWLLPVLLLLSACNIPFFTRDDGVTPPSLLGSTYRMTASAGQPLPDDARYLLSFAEQRISGKVCNQFSGGYAHKDGTLQAYNLISTKMMCMDPQVSAIESGLLQALRNGVTLQRSAHRMVLLDGSGQPLFSFVLFMD